MITYEGNTEEQKREWIMHSFDESVFVEAGAGAGKTTLLVNRICNQLQSGCAKCGEIVAITFTKKAAAELYERIVAELHQRLQKAEGDLDVKRLNKAIKELDQMQISTIHSFCMKIVKEFPFDAGIGLDLERMEGEEEIFQREFIRKAINQMAEEKSSLWLENEKYNRESQALETKNKRYDYDSAAFEKNWHEICGHLYVDYQEVPVQNSVDRSSLQKQMWELLEKIREDMKQVAADSGQAWSKTFRDLLENGESAQNQIAKEMGSADKYVFLTNRLFGKWDEHHNYYEDMLKFAVGKTSLLSGPMFGTANKRKDMSDWWEDHKENYKVEAESLIDQYRACRYNVVIQIYKQWIKEYREEEKREGKLSDNNILLYTKEILENQKVCERLAERYRYIYVDEYQDTDWLQTMIMEKLWRGTDEKKVKMFFVGDPKQSIYAFRGADVRLFEWQRERFVKEPNCEYISLSNNYRSNDAICKWMNAGYEKQYDNYLKMNAAGKHNTQDLENQIAGVYSLFDKEQMKNMEENGQLDDPKYISDKVAGMISSMVKQEKLVYDATKGEPRPVQYGDFLVLFWVMNNMQVYMQTFQKYGIPVSMDGKISLVNNRMFQRYYSILDFFATPNRLTMAVLLKQCYGIEPKIKAVKMEDGMLKGEQKAYRSGLPYWLLEDNNLSNERLEQLDMLWEKSRELTPIAFAWFLLSCLEMLIGSYIHEKEVYSLEELQADVSNLYQLLAGLEEKEITDLPSLVECISREQVFEHRLPLSEDQSNCLRMMNIHKAKGLEGKIVIIPESPKRKNNKSTYYDCDGLNPVKGYLRLFPKDTFSILPWENMYKKQREVDAMQEQNVSYVMHTRAKEAMFLLPDDSMENVKLETFSTLETKNEKNEQNEQAVLREEEVQGKIAGDALQDRIAHLSGKVRKVKLPSRDDETE